MPFPVVTDVDLVVQEAPVGSAQITNTQIMATVVTEEELVLQITNVTAIVQATGAVIGEIQTTANPVTIVLGEGVPGPPGPQGPPGPEGNNPFYYQSFGGL